uniref:Uncharacterized protein n=1 Tax=Lates calcarifer TaxID=8187 RepID=A0A4W6EHK1_LATCA
QCVDISSLLQNVLPEYYNSKHFRSYYSQSITAKHLLAVVHLQTLSCSVRNIFSHKLQHSLMKTLKKRESGNASPSGQCHLSLKHLQRQ